MLSPVVTFITPPSTTTTNSATAIQNTTTREASCSSEWMPYCPTV